MVNNMLIKALKRVDNTAVPDMVEMETRFKIGDKFNMEYDWCESYPVMCGEKRIWHKDTAEFNVIDIVCNALINPHSVWIRLSSKDTLFIKRCGDEEFDMPEEQAIERLAA